MTEKTENEIIAAAYIAAADVFETYANDQIGSKRFQATKRAKDDCDLRASIWTDAAKELRTAAAQNKPAANIDRQKEPNVKV